MNTPTTGWHMKKEWNVSHVIMTLSLAGGLIAGWVALNNRVVTVEVGLEHLQTSHALLRQDAKEAQAEVLQELRAIRERIDQMAERIAR